MKRGKERWRKLAASISAGSRQAREEKEKDRRSPTRLGTFSIFTRNFLSSRNFEASFAVLFKQTKKKKKEIHGPSRGGFTFLYDELLRRGKRLRAFASDPFPREISLPTFFHGAHATPSHRTGKASPRFPRAEARSARFSPTRRRATLGFSLKLRLLTIRRTVGRARFVGGIATGTDRD